MPFSDLVVENLGENVDEQTATGLNACFDNTGLVQAYNLTDELDFSGKIETQLAILEKLDVSTSLGPAHESILAAGKAIENIDLAPLFVELNSLAADGVSTRNTNLICADYVVPQDHSFEFTAENVREPWLVHASGQKATWSGESFARAGAETGLQYIQRVYKSSCHGLPVPFDEAIELAWTVAAGTAQMKEDMLRDLGTDTVLCAALGCPTDDFEFSDSVYVFLVEYEAKLVNLQITMVAWTDSTVGKAVGLASSFQCNAKCSFVRLAYDSLHESLCTTTISGFQSVSLALLFLGICNVPVVIISAIMVVRLRGLWVSLWTLEIGIRFGTKVGFLV